MANKKKQRFGEWKVIWHDTTHQLIKWETILTKTTKQENYCFFFSNLFVFGATKHITIKETLYFYHLFLLLYTVDILLKFTLCCYSPWLDHLFSFQKRNFYIACASCVFTWFFFLMYTTRHKSIRKLDELK